MHVLATGKGDELFDTAKGLAEELEATGMDVLYDDRRKVSAGVKFADAELIGIPLALVIGRGLKDGLVEVRQRATGEKTEMPLAQAVEALKAAHAEILGGK